MLSKETYIRRRAELLSLMEGTTWAFSAQAPLPDGGGGDLSARLFLLADDTYIPLEDFTPLDVAS